MTEDQLKDAEQLVVEFVSVRYGNCDRCGDANVRINGECVCAPCVEANRKQMAVQLLKDALAGIAQLKEKNLCLEALLEAARRPLEKVHESCARCHQPIRVCDGMIEDKEKGARHLACANFELYEAASAAGLRLAEVIKESEQAMFDVGISYGRMSARWTTLKDHAERLRSGRVELHRADPTVQNLSSRVMAEMFCNMIAAIEKETPARDAPGQSALTVMLVDDRGDVLAEQPLVDVLEWIRKHGKFKVGTYGCLIEPTQGTRRL